MILNIKSISNGSSAPINILFRMHDIFKYHCLSFLLETFIYSSWNTLHSQLILIRKHATKRQNLDKRKGRKKKPPLFPMCSFFYFTLSSCSAKPARSQFLPAPPQNTTNIDMVKEKLICKKKI